LFCSNIIENDTGYAEWIDNFNRNYGVGNVKLKEGVYRSGNWTARAVHKSCISPDDINRNIMDGKVLRAIGLPDDLFTAKVLQTWVRDRMKHVDECGMKYRKQSLIKKWDVRRVPLKPSMSDLAGKPKWVAGLRRNDLSRFHPHSLMKHNIGANQGLLKVLHEMWTGGVRPIRDTKTLRMIVADSNIFKRILKVLIFHFSFSYAYDISIVLCTMQFCYDDSEVACEFRSRVSPVLGLWHSYKIANQLLFEAGAFDFWIGLQLEMFPNNNVYPNRKLLKNVWWFNLIRISYPQWKSHLKDLIQEIDDDDVRYNHLLNLQAFMEFFIPVVRTLHTIVLFLVYIRKYSIDQNLTRHVQTQDYGIALKLNDGALIIRCMAKLLKVFLCLQRGNRQSEYVTCIIAQMLIFADWNRQHRCSGDHPMMKQFLDDPSIFNEEAGEISLSVMTRGMSVIGKTCDRKMLQDEFRMIHARMSTARDLKVDLTSDGLDNRQNERSEQMTSQKAGEEIKACSAYFCTILREIKANSWRPTKGTGSSWSHLKKKRNTATTVYPPLTRASTASSAVPLVDQLFLQSTKSKIQKAILKTVSQLDNHDWLAKEGSREWGVDKNSDAKDKRQPRLDHESAEEGNGGGGGDGVGGNDPPRGSVVPFGNDVGVDDEKMRHGHSNDDSDGNAPPSPSSESSAPLSPKHGLGMDDEDDDGESDGGGGGMKRSIYSSYNQGGAKKRRRE
jgi:hypothetical protein